MKSVKSVDKKNNLITKNLKIMKTNLMMMAAIAAVGMTLVSCSSDNESLVEDVKPGKAHV